MIQGEASSPAGAEIQDLPFGSQSSRVSTSGATPGLTSKALPPAAHSPFFLHVLCGFRGARHASSHMASEPLSFVVGKESSSYCAGLKRRNFRSPPAAGQARRPGSDVCHTRLDLNQKPVTEEAEAGRCNRQYLVPS